MFSLRMDYNASNIKAFVLLYVSLYWRLCLTQHASDLISFQHFSSCIECLLLHQEIVSVVSSSRSLQARRYVVGGFGSPRTDVITFELA